MISQYIWPKARTALLPGMSVYTIIWEQESPQADMANYSIEIHVNIIVRFWSTASLF